MTPNTNLPLQQKLKHNNQRQAPKPLQAHQRNRQLLPSQPTQRQNNYIILSIALIVIIPVVLGAVIITMATTPRAGRITKLFASNVVAPITKALLCGDKAGNYAL